MRKKTLLSLLAAGLMLSGAGTAQAGTPYNGPHNIPCTVQAEDFDEGGLGVAYNDDSGISSSKQVNYRPDNPDVEMEFIEGQTDGPYIGSAGDGQNCWYNYTVVAPSAGNLPISPHTPPLFAGIMCAGHAHKSGKKYVNSADIRLKTYKKECFRGGFGGGGDQFRTISPHLPKKSGGGDRFRTIPVRF